LPDGGFFYDRNCAAQPPFAFFSARLILFVCPPSQTRLQWFTRHRPKRKSWQLSARMRQEIDAASNFVSNLPADTSVSGGQRQLFRQVNNSTRYQGEGRGGRGGGGAGYGKGSDLFFLPSDSRTAYGGQVPKALERRATIVR